MSLISSMCYLLECMIIHIAVSYTHLVLESGMFSQYDIPKILAALAVALILGSVIYLCLLYTSGFLAGCVLFYFIVMIRLERYTRRLPYYILSIQPEMCIRDSGRAV